MRLTLKLIGYLQFVFVAHTLCAAEINSAEYYIGADPGEGNGVSLDLEGEEVLSVGLKEASVALSGLEPGVYDVGVRVKDANGQWSNAIIRRIEYTGSDFELAGDLNPALPSTQGVGTAGVVLSTFTGDETAEYYIGVDPGEGNGVSLDLEGEGALSVGLKEASVALSGLEPGVYDVGVRVKDANGQWSNAIIRRIEYTGSDFELAGDLNPALPSTQGAGTVGEVLSTFTGDEAAEYYIGVDPGEGNGVALELEGEEVLSVGLKEASVALSELDPGVYDVGVRVKDANGEWSNAVIRRIQKFSQDIIAETEAEIKDQATQPDKGIKKAWIISVLPDQVKETHLIKIGAKTIQVVRDSDENDVQFLNKIKSVLEKDLYVVTRFDIKINSDDSIVVTHLEEGLLNNFVVASESLNVELESVGRLSKESSKIVSAEYFFNLDPGEGKGVAVEVAESGANDAIFNEIKVPMWRYKSGNHRVGVRFKNAAGQWGNVLYRGISMFTVFGEDDVTPPVISLSQEAVTEWSLGTDFEYNDVSANDPEDGDLSSNLIVEKPLDPTLEGEQVIRYVVADYAGNVTKFDRNILVTAKEEINEPPEIVTSSFSVIEGKNEIGEIVATDPNDDEFLISILGEDDRFVIEGSKILVSVDYVLDFEKDPVLEVSLQVSDGDLTSDKTITIDIIDDREEDSDGDGLTEAEEEDIHGTSDLVADTDEDGFSDYDEVIEGSDPVKVDEYPTREITIIGSFEGKGTLSIGDQSLFRKGSTVEIVASAEAGYLFDSWFGDIEETTETISIVMNSNKTIGPLFDEDLRDSDDDGVTNYAEIVIHFTDPQNPDTDNDGYSDGVELAAGLNPKDETIFPNEAPIIEDQTLSVVENTAAGLIIGDLIAQDANGDTLSFSILSSEDADGDGIDAFVLVGNKLLVLDKDDLDYETKNSLTLNVQVKDKELTDNAEVLIAITDDREEDSDGDGLTQSVEEDIHGTSDLLVDTDGDGFSDPEELNEGTSPKDPLSFPVPPVEGDKDGDGWKDETEFLFGSLVDDPENIPDFKIKVNVLGGNEIEILFPAENESRYLIQISSNLERWLSLRIVNGDGGTSRERFSILDGYGFFRVLKE